MRDRIRSVTTIRSPTTTEAAVGDRVVVRYRKGPGAPGDWRRDPSATASDVTGVLVSSEGDLVVDRDGDIVTVPADLVVTVRALSDRPVRNSDIRRLEWAAARGWPGVESAMIDGWLVRAGGGFSRRANSAAPLERGATLDAGTVDRIRQWFGERHITPRCAVVERLIPSTHVDPGRLEVQAVNMIRAMQPPIDTAAATVAFTSRPSQAWVAAYVGGSGRDTDPDVAASVLASSIGGTVAFATVADADGVVAIGRVAVTTDGPTSDDDAGARWAGISCLATTPRARGAGIGSAVVGELLRFGSEHGAAHAYLQVQTGNVAAIRLYRRLGFARHHTYGYITV